MTADISHHHSGDCPQQFSSKETITLSNLGALKGEKPSFVAHAVPTLSFSPDDARPESYDRAGAGENDDSDR
jgi:hypothetical protein